MSVKTGVTTINIMINIKELLTIFYPNYPIFILSYNWNTFSQNMNYRKDKFHHDHVLMYYLKI